MFSGFIILSLTRLALTALVSLRNGYGLGVDDVLDLDILTLCVRGLWPGCQVPQQRTTAGVVVSRPPFYLAIKQTFGRLLPSLSKTYSNTYQYDSDNY